MEYFYKKWYKNWKNDEQGARDYHAALMQDETTVKLPFTISPMHSEDIFQLYYRPTNEMMVQMACIYQQDAALMMLDMLANDGGSSMAVSMNLTPSLVVRDSVRELRP